LLSPLAAQQLAPRLLPGPFPQAPVGAPERIDAEVVLGGDGSFVVAVLAADGSPIGGARVTVTSAAKGSASSQTWKTQANGTVAVSGLKPGVYQVAIVANQGRYRGVLVVHSADLKVAQHGVAFMLGCECTAEVHECLDCLPLGCPRLLTAGLMNPLLVGAGAAAALSLTLGGEPEDPIMPVASP
jgi:hypothetical protein